MEQNIFQVVTENHLNDIFYKNMKTLTLIMVGSNTPVHKALKIKFIELSKSYKNIFFIHDLSHRLEQSYLMPEHTYSLRK